MNLHKFSHAKELISIAPTIDVKANLLSKEQAEKYISYVLNKYHPWKTTGHLSIGDNAGKLSTEENEFTFSLSMKNEPAYIFFEQNTINKNDVVVIENAKNISKLMENSHGMEYFISDKNATYLIAVNWYSIEYTGDIEFLNPNMY